MKKHKASFTVGLDLGGTKLATALVDNKGRIIEYNKYPLNLSSEVTVKTSQKKVSELLYNSCADYKRRYPVETSKKYFKGIGIASAGPLNVNTGELINPANFRGWKRYKIVNILKTNLQKINWSPDLFFQNDAMSAAFAEKWIGSAYNCKSFAVITVGTGIGTGVIVNGQPCQTDGMGSEWGHILVNLPAYKLVQNKISNYTVEGLASGTALVSRAGEKGFKVNSVEELILQIKTHPHLMSLFDDMAWALASLCYNLSLGFNLEKIVFSGGLIKVKELFLNQTIATYSKMIREKNPIFQTKLIVAKAGNKAGVLGAAYLPHRKDQKIYV